MACPMLALARARRNDEGMIAATSCSSLGACTALLIAAVMGIGCATITEHRQEMILSREVVHLPPREEPGPARMAASGWAEDGAIVVQLFDERGVVSEIAEHQNVQVKTVREPNTWLFFAGDVSAAAGTAAIAILMQHSIDKCDRFEDDFGCRFAGKIYQTPAIAMSIGFTIAAAVELARAIDSQRIVPRLTPPIASTRAAVRSAMPAGRAVTIAWSETRLDGVTDHQGVAHFAVNRDRLPDADFRVQVECYGLVAPDVEIRRLGPVSRPPGADGGHDADRDLK
jgi:hypothetical protein